VKDLGGERAHRYGENAGVESAVGGGTKALILQKVRCLGEENMKKLSDLREIPEDVTRKGRGVRGKVAWHTLERQQWGYSGGGKATMKVRQNLYFGKKYKPGEGNLQRGVFREKLPKSGVSSGTTKRERPCSTTLKQEDYLGRGGGETTDWGWEKGSVQLDALKLGAESALVNLGTH